MSRLALTSADRRTPSNGRTSAVRRHWRCAAGRRRGHLAVTDEFPRVPACPRRSSSLKWNNGELSEARRGTRRKQRRLTSRWLSRAFRSFHSADASAVHVFNDSRWRQGDRRGNAEYPDLSAKTNTHAFIWLGIQRNTIVSERVRSCNAGLSVTDWLTGEIQDIHDRGCQCIDLPINLSQMYVFGSMENQGQHWQTYVLLSQHWNRDLHSTVDARLMFILALKVSRFYVVIIICTYTTITFC